MDKDRINWLLRAVARKDAEAMRFVIQCLSTHDDPKNLHPLCCVGRLEARLSDSDRALVEVDPLCPTNECKGVCDPDGHGL